MTGLHDPAFGVRRVLWLAYGVLAVALIFFIAAIMMLRDHHAPGITLQPPAAASPSAAPALTQNPATGATGGSGSDQARAQNGGPSRSWTGTGFAPGEPPGDIEDEPRGGSGSGTASSNPSGSSVGGALPPLTVPNPALPSVVPHAAASVIPSVIPSLLPTALPTPPI